MVIGVLAIIYIYMKLKDNYLDYAHYLSIHNVNYLMLIGALLLTLINWGIEAFKWRFLIAPVQQISLLEASKIVVISITVGIITPNRLGEIPSRVWLLNNNKVLKSLITFTSYGAYAQGITTLLFGSVGLYFTRNYFETIPFIDGVWMAFMTGTFFFFFLYFNVSFFKLLEKVVPFIKKRKILTAMNEMSIYSLFKVLLLCMIRYSVFFFQYYLILSAFNIQLESNLDLLLICVCFMLTTVIPTILLSEIGVRGGVALFIFGIISDHDIAIVLASLTLWIINVALPAIIGVFGLSQLKVYANK